MRVWCNYKWLAKLPKIGSPQFMDCDRKVVLMSKHPALKDEYKCTDKLLKKMKCLELHDKCRGLHFTCNPRKGSNSDLPRYNVIYIDHMIHGDKKLLSTIVHEISHLVDNLLNNASVKEVDTEVRAYMLQYYVEHVFSMLDFSFSTTELTVRQAKWGKKLDKVKTKLLIKLNLKHTGELYTAVTAKQIRDTGVKNVEMMFQPGPRK